jgi:hypothetical protein
METIMVCTMPKLNKSCAVAHSSQLPPHRCSNYACGFCARNESVEHAFLHCQFAHEVWDGMKTAFGVRLNRKSFVHAKQWLLEWILHANDVHAMVFAFPVWHILEARNDVRNGGNMSHPCRIVEKIKGYVDMTLHHSSKTKSFTRCETPASVPNWSPLPEGLVMVNVVWALVLWYASVPKWSPLPEGLVTVNVDAALNVGLRRMGAGAVVRDDCSGFLMGFCHSFDNVTEPELAEACTVRYAMMAVAESVFTK